MTVDSSPHDSSHHAPLTFDDVLQRSLSRRTLIKGGVGLAVSSILSACGSTNGGSGSIGSPGVDPVMGEELANLPLNFRSIVTSGGDVVSVPDGHSAQVLYACGDPLFSSLPEYSNAGLEGGEEFDARSGDHHDGMRFFGLNDRDEIDNTTSSRGILCLNHENITQLLLHPAGPTQDSAGNRLRVDEVRKEQRAHGISCIEIQRDESSGQFEVVRDSRFNRRITALTPVDIMGPLRGSEKLVTRYSPDGTEGRGTLNNCANGYTPWGTYLTCEENFALYFRDERNLNRSNSNPDALGYENFLTGVGIRSPRGLYGWATLAGHPDERDDEFARFNATPTTTDPSSDYRHEANQFGYIVEIDPLNPDSAPRKRTAMGRFAHEGVWPSNIATGQAVAFYMGDDDQLQFIYKFVSNTRYDGPEQGVSALDIGDRYLDDGILYVARFDPADSTGALRGEWLPLTIDNPVLAEANGPGGRFPGLFDSDASIILNTRAAAFAVGATPMDRPEWGAVHGSGEVYFTLTNNSDRRGFDDNNAADAAAGDEGTRDEVSEFLADREFGVDAANPRGPNNDGHIVRLREDNQDAAATTFEWDIFLFGSAAGNSSTANNPSGLTADNEFSGCDGLFFDAGNLLWIQTDSRQPSGNNQMLAALVGEVGDGGISADNNAERLRRFLVGPLGCEITGISITPDRRSLFVNIQHPGDDAEVSGDGRFEFNGNWPSDNRDATEAAGANNRPRSATIVITRDDGGTLGIG